LRHRIRVRTSNLAEWSFEEERRRTKVIPGLMTEKATMKSAFATMIRSAERWCRVSVTDFERHQLRLLRAELGLNAPRAHDQSTRRRRTANAPRHERRPETFSGHSGLDLRRGMDEPGPVRPQ
jgi:hypothetical protein